MREKRARTALDVPRLRPHQAVGPVGMFCQAAHGHRHLRRDNPPSTRDRRIRAAGVVGWNEESPTWLPPGPLQG